MTDVPRQDPPIPTAIPPDAQRLAPTDADVELDELPPRPRRRLLGAGGNPVQVALLGVLLLACGFIGGVLVEKDHASAASAGGAAAALGGGRGFALGGGGAGAVSGSPGFGGAGGSRGRPGGGGATIGEVTYIAGGTLYVSGIEGNTVKVTTSAASSITRTVRAHLRDIHPGDTVVVRGVEGSGGAISAESLSVAASGIAGAPVGSAGAFGRFGGLGGRQGAARGAGVGAGAAGEPTLFGR